MKIAFTLEDAVGEELERFRSVNWDAVVAAAIRMKLKILRQSTAPVPPANREPLPWLATAAPSREIRPKAKPSRPQRRPKAPPAPEEIARRRDLLRLG